MYKPLIIMRQDKSFTILPILAAHCPELVPHSQDRVPQFQCIMTVLRIYTLKFTELHVEVESCSKILSCDTLLPGFLINII